MIFQIHHQKRIVFDTVIMLGTASNIQNFSATVAKIHDILKPTGFIFFNFPNAASLIAKIYGGKFWMFTPSILNFMTQRGCRINLTTNGFVNIDFRTDWQRPSISKLVHHSKIDRAVPFLKYFDLNKSLPFSIMIPGIKNVTAYKPAAHSGEREHSTLSS